MEKKLLFLCLVGFPLTVVCGNFLCDPPLQGDHYFFYAQYDSAVIHYREAAARFNSSKSYHEYACVLNKLTELYLETEKFNNAGECIHAIMDIPLAHLPENDPERIYASINRGILIAESGYADEAMDIFKKSLTELIDAGYDRHPYAAVAYTCIGIEYDRIWEFSRSISYHTVAIKILQNHFPGNHPAIAKQLFRLSNSHILYNAGYNRFQAYYFEEPYRWLRKAIDICHENYGIQHPYTGVAYNQLSNLFFYTKDIDSTLCYSRMAQDILAQYWPENHLYMVLVHQHLCYTHQRMKSYQKATQHMKEAIRLLESREILNRRRLAWSYNWLVRVTTEPNSRNHLQFKAMQAINPGFSDTCRFAIPGTDSLVFKRYYIQLMTTKSIFHLNSYCSNGEPRHLDAFIETALAMQQVYESFQIKRTVRTAKENLADEIHHITKYAGYAAFDKYLRAGEMQHLESAFHFSEKNKSFLLSTLLQQSEMTYLAGLPAEVRQKGKELISRISKLENSIINCVAKFTAYDSLPLAERRIELCFLLEEYDRFMEDTEHSCLEENPKEKKIALARTDDIRSALDNSSALIAYDIIDNPYCKTLSLISYFITCDTVTAIIQPLSEEFYATIKTYRGFFTSSACHENRDREQFVHSASNLYNLLLAPGEEVIRGKKLIIVPEQALCQIPFEALLTEPAGATTPYNDLPWLVRSHTISYAHSASIFLQNMNRKKMPPGREKLLAFAPSIDIRNRPVDSLLAEWISRGEDLSELKETANEVAAIGKLFKGKVWTGHGATEKTFKEQAGRYEIIHIATHAIVDDNSPMHSRFVFARDETDGEDGYLHVYELYEMELNAGLAVLSACNTGYGRQIHGEGVISLARGFAYAGVPSVVMSLWKVKDRSTSVLMQKFYGYLKQGLDKDVALQQAKLDYLKEADPFFSQPHFWAGFVLIGDNSPLHTGKKPPVAWWLAGMVMFLLILASGIIYYRRGAGA